MGVRPEGMLMETRGVELKAWERDGKEAPESVKKIVRVERLKA